MTTSPGVNIAGTESVFPLPKTKPPLLNPLRPIRVILFIKFLEDLNILISAPLNFPASFNPDVTPVPAGTIPRPMDAALIKLVASVKPLVKIPKPIAAAPTPATKTGKNVSINFWWRELHVQIRISGSISEASRKESEEYFNSRPKGSRISAIISKQSEEIESFESFQEKVETAINTLGDEDIKLPEHCGMYKIKPLQIEIWKEGEYRRHERKQFKLEGKKWIKSFLSP